MDPLSIIGAVTSISKTVYSASTTLYTFVNETTNVDQTVKDLATEVNALSRALAEVEEVLNSPTVVAAEKRGSTDDNKQLWQTVYGSLEDCQITVVRIDSALDGVRNKRLNWATQAFRQVKLNLRKDEINSLRAQTHTHCSALKMALQMVTIRAAYMAPEVVITDLGPRIENLQGCLDLLTTSLEKQRREISHMSRNLPKIDSTNTERLRLLATRILSRATTVHGSTVAGRSVYNDPITKETRLRTMNWIPEPIISESVFSRSSAPLARGDPSFFSEPDSTVDTDLNEGTTPHNKPDLADSDSDGEFEFDFTQRLLDKGKKLFDLANYAESVVFLQKGIASSNRLPNSQKIQLDLVEVPMMIATCKYHLNELDQAEGDLLILVRQESTSDQDAVRACQISHLLSQIFLIKNELDASEDHCRKSLKGRRRLLGKEHKDYFASLGLLSEICNVRGKDEEAGVYQDMIPPEVALLQKKIRLEEYRPKKAILNVKKLETSPEKLRRLKSILKGHTGWVGAVAFSPDGRLVATGSGDETARLWDAATGATRATLEGHTGWVRAVAFSPDGRLVATGSHDKTARLWDAATGATRATLEGHTGWVRAVAFSPDGRLVATGSDDKTARLWDAATGATRATLEGHTGWVRAVAFSPDGRLVATGSGDKTARLWDAATGATRATLEGHTGWVRAVAFSPDGRLVATGSGDKTARLWDAATGATRATLEGHTGWVRAVAFSPDGRLVATGSGDETARLWDAATGATRATLEGHTGSVRAVAFSPDGRLVATGSDDKTARLWDAATGATRATLEGHTGSVWAVAFSPDGRLVATGSHDKTARLWGQGDEII